MKKYINVYIIALLCCIAEINDIVNQLYIQINEQINKMHEFI